MDNDRSFAATCRDLPPRLRARRDGLVDGVSRLMGAAAPSVPAEARKGLAVRVITSLTGCIESRSQGDRAPESGLDGPGMAQVSTADLFSVVYLAERLALDELAQDDTFGSTSDLWPTVVSAVRRSSFDVLAAFCDERSAGLMDPTTNLLSRAAFDRALTKEVQRAVRYRHTLAVILLDLDGFARLNAVHGAGVGDRVLERMGVFVKSFFREPDWIARHGPDSVAVLLPETSGRDATRLAEQARHAIETRLAFTDLEGHPVPVTVSAAVATVTVRRDEDHPGEISVGAERVMAEAEAGLRRAAMRGGNVLERVEIVRPSLSVSEAARYLHCSPTTVRRLVASGTLPAVESAGRTRIDKMSAKAYAQRVRHR